MARLTLTKQQLKRDGTDVTLTPILLADGGAYPSEGGDNHLIVQNTSGAAITMTFLTNATLDGIILGNKPAISIAANARIALNAFPDYPYKQVDGAVWFDVSADGLSVACVYNNRTG